MMKLLFPIGLALILFHHADSNAEWKLCNMGSPYFQQGFAKDSSLYVVTTPIPGKSEMEMYRTADSGTSWEKCVLPFKGDAFFWRCEDSGGGYELYLTNLGVFHCNKDNVVTHSNEILKKSTGKMVPWPDIGWVPTAPVQMGRHWFFNDNVIFHSADDGRTWELIDNWCLLDSATGIIGECSDYDDRYYLFSIARNGSQLVAGTYRSLAISLDSGRNWKDQQPIPKNQSTQFIGVTSTGIFASTRDAAIYLTRDTGKTWTAVNDSLPVVFRNQFEELSPLTIINDTPYLAVRSGIFSFTQNHWQRIASDFPADASPVSLIHCNNTFYSITTAGLFQVVNNRWVPISNPSESARSMATTITSYRDTLYAGSAAGVFYSVDNGESWVNISAGISEKIYITSIYAGPQGVFAANIRSGLFRSAAPSYIWHPITTDTTLIRYIFSIVNFHDKLLTTSLWSNGMYVVDEPKELSKILNSNTSSVICIGDTMLVAPTIPIQLNNEIVSKSCQILRSFDGGIHWDSSITSLTEVHDLHYTNGVIVASSPFKLYTSQNYGATWISNTAPRMNQYGRTLATDGTTIFSLRDSAIVFSSDTGATWETKPLPKWVKLTYCTALHIEKGFAFIAGQYGLWKVPLDELINPSDIITIPSPHTTITNIRFSAAHLAITLPHKGCITFEYFSLDGKVLQRTTSGLLGMGTHHLALPTVTYKGVYVIKASFGDRYATCIRTAGLKRFGPVRR